MPIRSRARLVLAGKDVLAFGKAVEALSRNTQNFAMHINRRRFSHFTLVSLLGPAVAIGCTPTDDPDEGSGGDPGAVAGTGGTGGGSGNTTDGGAGGGTPGLPGAPVNADYGDAPDGRVKPDGTFGTDGYPTLYGADGARVLDTTAAALAFQPAAEMVSAETNANDAADPDGEPNFVKFLEPQPDAENRDDHDNGVITATLVFTDPFNPTLDVEVGAYLKDTSQAGTYYLNVLFDQNFDGAWNGAGDDFPADGFPASVSSTNLSNEWIVQNVAVELTEAARMKTLLFNVPILGALLAARASVDRPGPYMRLALTDEAISGSAWKGQGEFAKGEIEDWAIRGLDDPPDMVCDAERHGMFGTPVFDFAGKRQMPLPCSLERPLGFPTGDILFDYFFEETFPGVTGKALVNVKCPVDGRGFALMQTGVSQTPMNCTATRVDLPKGKTSDHTVEIITDLDGSTAITRGFDSAIDVATSWFGDYVSFVNTADDVLEDDILTACIGLSGSHVGLNSGLIWQLAGTDCGFVPNDGMTDGTFILSGGIGKFGDMILTELGGNGWDPSGIATTLRVDGVDIDGISWPGPPLGTAQIVDIEFATGLVFQIKVEKSLDLEGNTMITQTILDGRRRP